MRLEAKVVETRPFERRNFTQGLEIHDGQLYVSAGFYGESALRVYDFATGKLLRERTLPPQTFAEGLTRLGDRLFQLTWQEHVLLRYDAATLAPQPSLELATEGWGLTHDAERLWYSDGSAQLRRVHPGTGAVERIVTVRLAGAPIDQLNELEWDKGRIWANLWQRDRIVRIDAASGAVDATLDLPGLLPVADRRADTDVLNGIAIDPADGAFWVTGKRWPTLFRLELRAAAGP